VAAGRIDVGAEDHFAFHFACHSSSRSAYHLTCRSALHSAHQLLRRGKQGQDLAAALEIEALGSMAHIGSQGAVTAVMVFELGVEVVDVAVEFEEEVERVVGLGEELLIWG